MRVLLSSAVSCQLVVSRCVDVLSRSSSWMKAITHDATRQIPVPLDSWHTRATRASAGTGSASLPPQASTSPASTFAAFGQQAPAPAFGHPQAAAGGQQAPAAAQQQQQLPGTPGRQGSTNPDGTVDVRSLGLTTREQVHSTTSDPFAGLGF